LQEYKTYDFELINTINETLAKWHIVFKDKLHKKYSSSTEDLLELLQKS